MSLIIQNLTKVYGAQKAVNDISFSVRRGEIVGFLGPNGAGKSTTMKIATSYLPPSSGQVVVEGLEVTSNPIQVKQMIGYLPEHNPLYLDLYVHEYLSFVGKVFGLSGKTLKARIAEIVELCGLQREQNKKIEALSKGYRQRVGIAQALIHDPKVLILDEPTSGLDPNQLLEIRKLIRDISTDKTVIFSTHIMQEVQALCERVVVINKGEIVADDRLEKLLAKRSGHLSIIIEFEMPVDVDRLKNISGVLDVVKLVSEKEGVHRYKISSVEGIDLRAELFRFAADQQLSLIGLKQEENSLEKMFQELTQQ
jgi:ABC-2 type transport system ATP-binding protein